VTIPLSGAGVDVSGALESTPLDESDALESGALESCVAPPSLDAAESSPLDPPSAADAASLSSSPVPKEAAGDELHAADATSIATMAPTFVPRSREERFTGVPFRTTDADMRRCGMR
jgi:hypothetical protein